MLGFAPLGVQALGAAYSSVAAENASLIDTVLTGGTKSGVVKGVMAHTSTVATDSTLVGGLVLFASLEDAASVVSTHNPFRTARSPMADEVQASGTRNGSRIAGLSLTGQVSTNSTALGSIIFSSEYESLTATSGDKWGVRTSPLSLEDTVATSSTSTGVRMTFGNVVSSTATDSEKLPFVTFGASISDAVRTISVPNGNVTFSGSVLDNVLTQSLLKGTLDWETKEPAASKWVLVGGPTDLWTDVTTKPTQWE